MKCVCMDVQVHSGVYVYICKPIHLCMYTCVYIYGCKNPSIDGKHMNESWRTEE